MCILLKSEKKLISIITKRLYRRDCKCQKMKKVIEVEQIITLA